MTGEEASPVIPFVVMIAGPNGSGKTTLTTRLRQSKIQLGEYINPDDIAGTLKGSYEARVQEAQKIADQCREACIESKTSFSFETVMSHSSKLEILSRAKAAGFRVRIFYVAVEDPRISISRVSNRVILGGHDVPEDRIIARWHRSLKLLHRAIRLSDQAFLFDNSTRSGPRSVLSWRRPNWVIPEPEAGSLPRWVARYALGHLWADAEA